MHTTTVEPVVVLTERLEDIGVQHGDCVTTLLRGLGVELLPQEPPRLILYSLEPLEGAIMLKGDTADHAHPLPTTLQLTPRAEQALVPLRFGKYFIHQATAVLTTKKTITITALCLHSFCRVPPTYTLTRQSAYRDFLQKYPV